MMLFILLHYFGTKSNCFNDTFLVCYMIMLCHVLHILCRLLLCFQIDDKYVHYYFEECYDWIWYLDLTVLVSLILASLLYAAKHTS